MKVGVGGDTTHQDDHAPGPQHPQTVPHHAAVTTNLPTILSGCLRFRMKIHNCCLVLCIITRRIHLNNKIYFCFAWRTLLCSKLDCLLSSVLAGVHDIDLEPIRNSIQINDQSEDSIHLEAVFFEQSGAIQPQQTCSIDEDRLLRSSLANAESMSGHSPHRHLTNQKTLIGSLSTQRTVFTMVARAQLTGAARHVSRTRGSVTTAVPGPSRM